MSQWVNVHEVELPSGNKPKIKQIDLMSLLARKRGIPEILIPIVERQINPKAKRAFEKGEVNLDDEDTTEMSQFLDWLCTKVFVEPKATYDEQPATVTEAYVLVEDISLEDKMHVLAWVMGGDAGVEAMRFRRATIGNVGSSRPVEVVQPTPIADNGAN